MSMIVGNLRRTACEENLPKRLRSSRVEPGLIPRKKKKKRKKVKGKYHINQRPVGQRRINIKNLNPFMVEDSQSTHQPATTAKLLGHITGK
jgi:hypothetical protein